MIVWLPSGFSVVVILAVLPSLPSLTLVVDSEPSGFLTVIECVPSPLSVTFTTGDLPSAPLAPLAPFSPFSPLSPFSPATP